MGTDRLVTVLRVAALAVAVAAVISSCADDAHQLRPGGSATVGPAPRTLVGSRWLLTEIKAGPRSLSVAPSLHASWQFGADQHFLASDTVNAISGLYRLGPNSFRTIDAATSLAGYLGHDPVRLAVIAAFQAMTTRPVDVASDAPPSTAVLRVAGYVLTFRRSGPAAVAAPATRTSETGH